jgi:K+-transporting ATPase ATPase C chain
MLSEIRPAIVIVIALTIITGLLYPLGMTGLAGLLFPREAEGSLVTRDGQVVGSALIGQQFATDAYFHGRPSATLDPADASGNTPLPYNAANSGASNYGPINPDLKARIDKDVAALRRENPQATVPVDLVTTSGSGLDPDITPEAAMFQVPRIAKARNLSEDRVRQLVAAAAENRFGGIIGEPRVNVLALNLELDRVAPR